MLLIRVCSRVHDTIPGDTTTAAKHMELAASSPFSGAVHLMASLASGYAFKLRREQIEDVLPLTALDNQVVGIGSGSY